MATRSPLRRALRKLSSRLWHDTGGAHLVITAFALVPVLGAVGVALDSARGYTVKSALTSALDNAALAAAHERTDAERQAAFDRMFDANFPANSFGVTNIATHLSYDPEMRRLSATASAELDTTFASLLGRDDLVVAVDNVVQSAQRGMELVLVMDNTGSMHGSSMTRMKEAARGLINALYTGHFDTAARHDTVLGEQDRLELDNLWVSLVPYTATVNIGRGADDQSWDGAAWQGGTEHYAWLNPARTVDGLQSPNAQGSSPDAFYQASYRVEHASDDPACLRDENGACVTDEAGDIVYQPVGGDPRGWLGCVMARPDGLDQTDEPPADPSTRFTPYLWLSNDAEGNSTPPTMSDNSNWRGSADDHWSDDFWNSWPDPLSLTDTEVGRRNGGRGPNLGCPPAITPLTPNYAEIMDAIDEMEAWHRGGTWSNVGMAWGWRALSPRWRSYWQSPHSRLGQTLPLDYNTRGMEKVIIVLTDGTNQWYQDDFTAFGYLSEGLSNSEGGLNGVTSNSGARVEANARMATICDRIRRGSGSTGDPALQENDPDRVSIYTIVLKATSQEATFEGCASAPENYYFASDNSQLSGIFEQVSEQLMTLRIAE
ncbi:MAG: hypothetical protein GVY13_03340 [Alphaproteobacteria bacterium]|jgi:Flp pilus assembly protein TadG|nr:hypothetical protein [Alphaproteobacteria bacterium]